MTTIWTASNKIMVKRNLVVLSICPSQILHILSWNWTQASMIRSILSDLTIGVPDGIFETDYFTRWPYFLQGQSYMQILSFQLLSPKTIR